MRRIAGTLMLCATLALVACGGDRAAGDRSGKDGVEGNLPAPESAGGPVTGMPDTPGPGQVGPPAPAGLPPDTPVASDGSIGLPPEDADALGDAVEPSFPGIPDEENAPSSMGEPGVQDAVRVLHDYYDAINAHDYARAYVLWSDGGRSSGQSPQQFADGFNDTRKVEVQIDAPGRLDAAAGSRFVEVPLAISATRNDGSVHRYVGAYALRRAVVDGATAEQRQWRIASADIREVRP